MALNKETVNLRKQFRKKYSTTTQKIIEAVAAGKTSSQVAYRLDVSTRTVGTTKGNLTRGFYAPYAFVVNNEVKGLCQF